MTTAIASMALLVAGWALLAARQARVRARAAMVTLAEVVGLLETLTEERALPASEMLREPEVSAMPRGSRVLPFARQVVAEPGYDAAEERDAGRSAIRERIAGLSAQGHSMTEICRTLSVSSREVALGLALGERKGARDDD